MGMDAKEATRVFGGGHRLGVDPSYRPKDVARTLETEGVKLLFLHDHLCEVTYRPEVDLSGALLRPFRESRYNLPTDVQRMLRWGMPFSDFRKVLDVWTKALTTSGMQLIRRSDEYLENVEDKQLDGRQFVMQALHPSRHEYWVTIGPAVPARANLPRVLWAFSFDPETSTLTTISATDRSKEGIIAIDSR